MKKQIKDIKAGEFFTLKGYGENDVPERAVWVRGEWSQPTKEVFRMYYKPKQ